MWFFIHTTLICKSCGPWLFVIPIQLKNSYTILNLFREPPHLIVSVCTEILGGLCLCLFLWDLMWNIDSDTMKIEECALTRAGSVTRSVWFRSSYRKQSLSLDEPLCRDLMLLQCPCCYTPAFDQFTSIKSKINPPICLTDESENRNWDWKN